jgi:hypothetical protein
MGSSELARRAAWSLRSTGVRGSSRAWRSGAPMLTGGGSGVAVERDPEPYEDEDATR